MAVAIRVAATVAATVAAATAAVVVAAAAAAAAAALKHKKQGLSTSVPRQERSMMVLMTSPNTLRSVPQPYALLLFFPPQKKHQRMGLSAQNPK